MGVYESYGRVSLGKRESHLFQAIRRFDFQPFVVAFKEIENPRHPRLLLSKPTSSNPPSPVDFVIPWSDEPVDDMSGTNRDDGQLPYVLRWIVQYVARNIRIRYIVLFVDSEHAERKVDWLMPVNAVQLSMTTDTTAAARADQEYSLFPRVHFVDRCKYIPDTPDAPSGYMEGNARISAMEMLNQAGEKPLQVIVPDPASRLKKNCPTENGMMVRLFAHKIPFTGGHFIVMDDDVFFVREMGMRNFFVPISTATTTKFVVNANSVQRKDVSGRSAHSMPGQWQQIESESSKTGHLLTDPYLGSIYNQRFVYRAKRQARLSGDSETSPNKEDDMLFARQQASEMTAVAASSDKFIKLPDMIPPAGSLVTRYHRLLGFIKSVLQACEKNTRTRSVSPPRTARVSATRARSTPRSKRKKAISTALAGRSKRQMPSSAVWRSSVLWSTTGGFRSEKPTWRTSTSRRTPRKRECWSSGRALRPDKPITPSR